MSKLNHFESEAFSNTEEGRLYLKYHEVTGGEPLGLIVPFGYPEGVKEMGGVIAVYEECIRRGVTWEELLGCSFNDPDIIY